MQAQSSFTNLWGHGGMFPNGINGFILSFQMVVFAFVGIELVGLTAGETEDPEKVIPRAINNIPIRVLIFYIGALIVIMSIYPWNAINPSEKPIRPSIRGGWYRCSCWYRQFCRPNIRCFGM